MTGKAQSYVHGASGAPLLGETLVRVLGARSRNGASGRASSSASRDVRWSYRELGERVDAFAAGLLALGLAPGDRVGIWSPNNAEWVLTQFATAKAGLILVNINPAYRLAELEYALNKVGCRALIIATAFKTSDYIGMLQELAPELSTREPGALRAASCRSSRPSSRSAARHARAIPLRQVYDMGEADRPRRGSGNSPAGCSSTIRSTSSSRQAPRARRRAPRSRTTMSSTTASSSAKRCAYR